MNETSKHKAPVRAAGLYPADILLPDFSAVSGTRWSVVACDQYTSQAGLLAEGRGVGGRCTLHPTADSAGGVVGRGARPHTRHSRRHGGLPAPRPAEPTGQHGAGGTPPARGQLRRGLVGCIDLEEYDYSRGAQSLIRATEATVPERIPPRMTIREGAWLELPHVMLLTDDRACTVVEPLADETDAMELAYDYDLMLDGGHLRGYFLTDSQKAHVAEALAALATPGGNGGALRAR